MAALLAVLLINNDFCQQEPGVTSMEQAISAMLQYWIGVPALESYI